MSTATETLTQPVDWVRESLTHIRHARFVMEEAWSRFSTAQEAFILAGADGISTVLDDGNLEAIQQDELAREVISELYWSDFPANQLSELLGLKGTSQVARFANPIAIDGVCEDCFQEFTVSCRTRTDRDHVRSRSSALHRQATQGISAKRSSTRLRCPECVDRKEQEHKSWREDQDKRMATYWEERQQVIDDLCAMPYREYLQTDHWREVRRRALGRARYACQLCNASGPLDVHHRTYENRGCEQPADVIVLCRPCHTRHHGLES